MQEIKNRKINIYIVGFPASGKTTIGKLLSKKIKFNFFDLDKEIEKKENKKVKEIIISKGLKYFRKIERKLLNTLIRKRNYVFSLGGGITLNKKTYSLFKNDITIFLDTPLYEIKNRIFKKIKERPLLIGKNKDLTLKKIENLYKKRLKYYKNANIIIKTKNLTSIEIVKRIIRKIK